MSTSKPTTADVVRAILAHNVAREACAANPGNWADECDAEAARKEAFQLGAANVPRSHRDRPRGHRGGKNKKKNNTEQQDKQ